MLSRVAAFSIRNIGSKVQHVKLPENNAHVIFPDVNDHLRREVLFRTKTKDRRDVSYELAEAEDDEQVVDFLKTFFIQNESLSATMKLDEEDAAACIAIFEPMFSYNILAKVDGNIVGVTSYSLEEHKQQIPLPVWPLDFGPQIDAGPTERRKVNVVLNWVFECEKIIYHTVPAPSLLAHAALLTVHPDFRGQGIGYVLDVGGYKVAYDRGADYIINTMSSVATNNMAMSLPGQKLIKNYQYTDYLDYGKMPFANVIDGGTCNGVYSLDLKKYWPVYEKLLDDTIKKFS